MRIFAEKGTYDDTIPIGVSYLYAKVTKIEKDYILVKPVHTDDGEEYMPGHLPWKESLRLGSGKYIPDEQTPQLRKGDIVTIFCDSFLLESKPAQIANVYAVHPHREEEGHMHSEQNILHVQYN